MRITIVIDDADATAVTQAAQTIGRAFAGTSGPSVAVSGPETDRPAAASAPAVDVDVGPAPRADRHQPSSSGTTPGSGNGRGSDGDGSTPVAPSRPAQPAGESVGAAPELGGG